MPGYEGQVTQGVKSQAAARFMARRMRRRPVSSVSATEGRCKRPGLRPVLVGAALLIAPVFGGCDGDEKAKQPPEPSLLFVQNASGGTLKAVEGKPGTYSLSLRGVDPHSLFFTDRPDRETGVVFADAMLRGLYRGGKPPPNAALEVLGGPSSQDVLAVELRRPRYNRSAGTMNYEARLLKDLTSPGLRHKDDRLDRKPPARFGRAALFIDSGGLGTTCHAHVTNLSSYAFKVQTATKWDTDSWDGRDPTGRLFGNDRGTPTWTYGTVSGFARGCHNTVVAAPQAAGNNRDATVRIDLTDPFPGDNQFSCTSARPEVFTCKQVAGSTTEGTNLMINYVIDDAANQPPP